MEENASNIFTAVAVCGCGHDGRLGITIPSCNTDNMKNKITHNFMYSNSSRISSSSIQETKPLRMTCDAPEICPEAVECITLIPELIVNDCFNTNHTKPNNNNSSSEPFIKVQSIHVGGYHNIICTSEGELYGWGLNENGELGLGQPSSANGTTTSHKAYFAHPTLLPFFQELQCKVNDTCMEQQLLPVVMDYKSETRKNFIIDVACGAHHSFVLTREGLHATGCNEYGQLGLGHTDNVFKWTCVLPRVLSQENKLCWEHTKENYQQSNSLSTYDEETNKEEFMATVMHAVITHISAGTHHSLLTLQDVIVCESHLSSDCNTQCDKNNVDTKLMNSELEQKEKEEYVYYPTLLMTCGKGDFGELGYDGKLWDTLQSRAARLQSQLTLQSNSANFNNFNYDSNNINGDSNNTNGDNEMQKRNALLNFEKKWKPKVERRPEFFSSTFQCVQIPLLTNYRRVITPNLLSKYCLIPQQETYCEQGYVKMNWSGVAHEMRCSITDTESYWSVKHLCAMHLHSSVILQKCYGKPKTINKNNEMYKTLHWGCYYCGAVEDLHSSHPQEEIVQTCLEKCSENTVNNNNINNLEALSHMTCINAGDEIIFRYSKPSAVHNTWESIIQVRGSGNVGNGDEENNTVQVNWSTLTLPQIVLDNCPANTSCANCAYITHNITGKNHFLIHTTISQDNGEITDINNNNNNNKSRKDVIFGFGDNLHGQLGHALTANTHLSSSNVNNGSNTANNDNDIVYSPRVILATGDVISTPTLPSQTQHGKCTKQESYVVHSINEVGTGARHSVFLLKVRKNNVLPTEDVCHEEGERW